MSQRIGYNPLNITVLPISAYYGDNLVDPSERLDWYKGPTLLEALNSIVPPKQDFKKPLRVPVQDVYKISGVGTVPIGRVVAGVMRPRMNITLAPGDRCAEVKSIQMHHRRL